MKTKAYSIKKTIYAFAASAAVYLLVAALGMGSVMLAAAPLSYAAEKINFTTKHKVVDGADDHFIVQNKAGKYGLLDSKGEEAIGFDYDNMVFPEDTRQYHFVMIKKGENWGVMDYDENEIIKPRYQTLAAFKDGNTVTAGYDGAVTDLYSFEGKSKGTLDGDYSKVISDTLFQGINDKKEPDLHNDRDNSVLDLKEKGLVDPKDETKSKILKMGENIAAQYYCGETGENFDKLTVDRYVKVYNSKGEMEKEITPQKDWFEDEENQFNGKLYLNKVVSDHTVLVTMKVPKGKESFKAIFDINGKKGKEYSKHYKVIGEFHDNHAFAIDMDDELFIINEKGEAITDDPIKEDGYERQAELSGKEAASHKAAWIFFTKDDDVRLYNISDEGKMLEGTYKEAILKDQGYVLLEDKDGKYGVFDEKGQEVVPFGDFEKDLLDSPDRAIYSDTAVTLLKESGEGNEVYSFSLAEKQKDGFFKKHKLLIGIILGVAVLLAILITVLVILRNKKKKAEEERKQLELIEEQRRKKEEQDRRRRLRERQLARQQMEEKARKDAQRDVQRQQKAAFSGTLTGIRGEYAGSQIRIKPGEKLRIGRMPEGNDLIINNAKVSRRHCQISYDSGTGKYRVTDFSSNGVYLRGGNRLQRNIEVLLDEGTIIYIGNEENAFELGSRRS